MPDHKIDDALLAEMSSTTNQNPEINKQVLVTAESNVKSPPRFAGSGEDPLKFIEEFKEAAIWNNWSQEQRKKDLFFRCLAGFAKEWYTSTIMASKGYTQGEIAFENAVDGKDSIIGLFEKKFVTSEWYARYEMWYDDRKQGAHESATQYMCSKLALYKKANASKLLDKSIKHVVKDIRKGLLPAIQRKCWEFEYSPYTPEEYRNLDTYEKLERLLQWVEQTIQGGTYNVGQGTAANVGQAGTQSMVQVNATQAVPTLSKFEQAVLEKLEKLDTEMVATKDKMAQYDRTLELLSKDRNKPSGGNAYKNNAGYSGKTLKCYNCHRPGHRASGCKEPCRCGATDHISMDCNQPEDFQQGSPL